MSFIIFLFSLLALGDFVLGFVVLFGGRGLDLGTAAVHFSLGAGIFILISIWWKVDNLLEVWEKRGTGNPHPRPEGPTP